VSGLAIVQVSRLVSDGMDAEEIDGRAAALAGRVTPRHAAGRGLTTLSWVEVATGLGPPSDNRLPGLRGGLAARGVPYTRGLYSTAIAGGAGTSGSFSGSATPSRDKERR